MARPPLPSIVSRAVPAVRRARRAPPTESGEGRARPQGGKGKTEGTAAAERTQASGAGTRAYTSGATAARSSPDRVDEQYAAPRDVPRAGRGRRLGRPRRRLRRRRPDGVSERIGVPCFRCVHGCIWEQRGHHVHDRDDLDCWRPLPHVTASSGAEGEAAAAGDDVSSCVHRSPHPAAR